MMLYVYVVCVFVVCVCTGLTILVRSKMSSLLKNVLNNIVNPVEHGLVSRTSKLINHVYCHVASVFCFASETPWLPIMFSWFQINFTCVLFSSMFIPLYA